MQGGVLHHHPAHGDRPQAGHRGHRPGAAHLDVDGLQEGPSLLGGELAGDGPAGGAGDEAQALLPVQPVDLVDHPINVEIQLRPLDLHGRVGGQQALGVLHPPGLRRGHEPPGLEQGQGLGLRGREGRADLAPGVGEEAQGPLGGDPGVQLAQGAGGGVAGVGVGAGSGGLGGGVQLGEGGVAQIDLAAHLDHRRPAGAGQPLGNFPQGAQVLGDVLPHPAVAAGGALDEDPVLVAQGGGQAVDLGLGGIGDGLVRQAQEPAHLGVELHRVVVGEGVVQGQHRRPMGHRRELLRPRRPHPQARRVLADQVREAGLDGAVALLERVVVGVGDRRGVFPMIADVMAGDLVGQPLQLGGGLGLGEGVGGFHRVSGASVR